MAVGTLVADDGAASSGRIEAVHSGTFTQMMEQLQEGYVASVAATAGCAFQPLYRDIIGMDVLLFRPGKTPNDQEASVFVQLKCTTTLKPDPTADHFSLKLKKREYFEKLAAPRSNPKSILLVMVTSPHQRAWSGATHEALSVSHCCYWVHLEGQVPAAGVEQPTVHVPTSNIFDAKALTDILDKLDRGDPLNGV